MSTLPDLTRSRSNCCYWQKAGYHGDGAAARLFPRISSNGHNVQQIQFGVQSGEIFPTSGSVPAPPAHFGHDLSDT